jgi:pimeloyl-ACP methyl ester carboxylesterase
VETSDGFEIAAQSTGEGPAVLLANGIGVTSPGLDLIAERLRERYRVIGWDYRGTGSSLPTARRPGDAPLDYAIERHAADALEVLASAGEKKAVVLGWSMGVPVALEMARIDKSSVAGLGALFGAAGRPFEYAFPYPVPALVHRLSRLFERVTWPPQLVLTAGAALPKACFAACSAVGFVGRHAHREIFGRNVSAVARADRAAYFATMTALMEHDARDILPSLECPVLVVAGRSDWITPVAAAKELAGLTPRAELVVLPKATHFGVIEHVPELWEPIERLLESANEQRDSG